MTSLRYHAPPVAYPVGRFALLPICLLGIALIVGLLQASRWAYAMVDVEWRWWSASMVALAMLIWLFWAWHQAPQGWLTWEPAVQPSGSLPCGGGWWWTDEADRIDVPLSKVLVGVRWPGGMWLRLSPAAGQSVPRWIWVARGRQPDRWLGLLRALQATTVRR